MPRWRSKRSQRRLQRGRYRLLAHPVSSPQARLRAAFRNSLLPGVGADDPAKRARRDGFRYRPLEEREPAGPSSEPNSAMRARSASETSAQSSTSFDRLLHAEFGRLTLGVSPFALWLAYADWAIHLSAAPGKRRQLIELPGAESGSASLARSGTCAEPGGAALHRPAVPPDHRFTGDAWREPPFRQIHQAFLLQQQWWHNATTGVRGVSRQATSESSLSPSEADPGYLSPSNFVLANPECCARP